MERRGDSAAGRPRRVLVPLAEGFEETEAVAVIDVLRRAELAVTVAGVTGGPITGSHGITLVPDTDLAQLDLASIDALVLPGGMPGTKHLIEDLRVIQLVRRLVEQGRPVAAICAAPRVLAEAGVVDGLDVTSHPSVRTMLGSAHVVAEPRVVAAATATGSTVVTSQGPGTALEFALELVRQWVGPERAAALGESMLVTH